MRARFIRNLSAAALLAGSVAIAGCGSDADSTPTTTLAPGTQAPGAGVDPDSDGFIGGPINSAKDAAGAANDAIDEREQQIEDLGAG